MIQNDVEIITFKYLQLSILQLISFDNLKYDLRRMYRYEVER